MRQCLEVLADLGVDRVPVTCDDDNEPSIRIIEGSGGILENVVATDKGFTRRYWLDNGSRR